MNVDLETVFPRLASTRYSITSPETTEYNCIAWAAGDTSSWWWPDRGGWCYWPSRVERRVTVDAFIQLFRSLGFVSCADGEPQSDLEKIAIFVKAGTPTHAARQLPSGEWTSKCGAGHDFSHHLNGLDGSDYGSPTVFMQRPRRAGNAVDERENSGV